MGSEFCLLFLKSTLQAEIKILLVLLYPLLLAFAVFFGDRSDFINIIFSHIVPLFYFIFSFRFISKFNFEKVFLYSILLRIFMLGAIPIWSDDIYRYLWDGYLFSNGFNPYLQTPNQIIDSLTNDRIYLDFLFQNMNSRGFFSVYPPLLISVFALPHFFAIHFVFTIFFVKVMFLGLEIINLLLLKKIFSKDVKKLWIYFGNPLVIIEGVGQLHPEILFVTAILLLLCYQKKGYLFSFFFILLINLKISFLVLAPILTKLKHKRQSHLFALVLLGAILVFLAAFLDISQLKSGLGLFFHSFRFHGFFETLLYLILGIVNLEYLSGIISLAFLAFVLLLLTIKNANFTLGELTFWIYLSFCLFAPVLHPWYLIPLIVFSMLVFDTKYLIFVMMFFSGLSYLLYVSFEISYYLTFLEIFILVLYVRKSHNYFRQKA